MAKKEKRFFEILDAKGAAAAATFATVNGLRRLAEAEGVLRPRPQTLNAAERAVRLAALKRAA